MAIYELKGRKITVCIDSETNGIQVTNGNTVWHITEFPFVKFADDSVVQLKKATGEATYKTGVARGVTLEYDNPDLHGIRIKTAVELEEVSDEVCFYCSTENDTFNQIKQISFPAPFDFGEPYGDSGADTSKHLPQSYTVLPRMQGALVPAGTKIKLENGLMYEWDARMPFFGQVRDKNGYLAIFETPYDAMYELRNENGEKVAPLWRTSLGHMSYKRKMRYVFLENCDYITMAKRYKKYVQSKGQFVTLKEKIAKNKNAEAMIGCPIVATHIASDIAPESPYYHKDEPEKNNVCTTFEARAEELRALHQRGLKKAYFHLDGWGSKGHDNGHPRAFPPNAGAGGPEGLKKLADVVKECGYVLALHDNYRDYYCNAPDFTLDESIMRADGTYPIHSLWLGGKETLLCASVARDYVKLNYEQLEACGIHVDSSYIDVFSCASMDECFHPAHPMTREQCAQYRRECFDYLTSKGIFCGSEEANDCIIPSLIYCHYEPYFTVPFFNMQGDPAGILIPLLNLVYHDCLIIPWRNSKGICGGMGIPKTDSAYDHAILNGGPVTLGLDADAQRIEEAHFACENAARLAHMEMIHHEFVTADRRIQRTTFTDGQKTVTVTVNFDTEAYKITEI